MYFSRYLFAHLLIGLSLAYIEVDFGLDITPIGVIGIICTDCPPEEWCRCSKAQELYFKVSYQVRECNYNISLLRNKWLTENHKLVKDNDIVNEQIKEILLQSEIVEKKLKIITDDVEALEIESNNLNNELSKLVNDNYLENALLTRKIISLNKDKKELDNLKIENEKSDIELIFS